MNKLLVGKSEEYIKAFRERRRLANRKYHSKPETRAKKKKYKKEYDLRNKEKISEYGKKLRARAEYQERVKNWREENKEHLSLYNKRRKEDPFSKIRKRLVDRAYQKENLEKIREINKQWRKRNSEKIKGYNDKYNSSEKGKALWVRANLLRRNYRKMCRTSEGKKMIRALWERDKVCVYCGSSKNLGVDHIVSIIKKGSDFWDNLVISCRSCNSSKCDRDVFEWCSMKKKEVPEIIQKKFCTTK